VHSERGVIDRLPTADDRIEELEGLGVLDRMVGISHDRKDRIAVLPDDRLAARDFASDPSGEDGTLRDPPIQVRRFERLLRVEHSVDHSSKSVPRVDAPAAEHFCAAFFRDAECV
jgi:hypothetical protein